MAKNCYKFPNTFVVLSFLYKYFIETGKHYCMSIYCTPDIILPSRKRRVINLKTIHRGENQLVFFQALVLPSFNDILI
jgi:hypothetical protein